MMTRFLLAGWLFSAICLLHGCENQQSPDEETDQPAQTTQTEKTVVDSWYHPAPSLPPTTNATELSNAEIYEVADTAETPAEALLQHTPSVPLSAQQAITFTNGQYKGMPGKSPYLVRAVYLNKETGGFSVSQQGSKLFVSHDSLGHSAVPMKRKALIVLLATSPTEVFVDCSMAE